MRNLGPCTWVFVLASGLGTSTTLVEAANPAGLENALNAVRSFLTPSHAWPNLLRIRRPWYRDARDIHGQPAEIGLPTR